MRQSKSTPMYSTWIPSTRGPTLISATPCGEKAATRRLAITTRNRYGLIRRTAKPTVRYAVSCFGTDAGKKFSPVGRSCSTRIHWTTTIGQVTRSCVCFSINPWNIAPRVRSWSIGSARFPVLALEEQIGRVCLLLPDSADEIENGVTLIDAATAPEQTLPDWIHPFIAFAKGLAEYRQGHFATAADQDEGRSIERAGFRAPAGVSDGPISARRSRGEPTYAGHSYRQLRLERPQADVRDVWINHILRREAEALIMPNLPGLVQGTAEPANNEERFALAGSCQFAGRWYDAARWYADALANDPEWIEAREADCLDRAHSGKPFLRVDELAYSCRYPWARCAVMSAGDVGENGADLNETERTQMRGLAQEWLLSDLELWKKVLELNPAAGREIVNQQLVRWQSDPDLAGVREASELEKLPPDERRDFAKLWDDVAQVVDRTK